MGQKITAVDAYELYHKDNDAKTLTEESFKKYLYDNNYELDDETIKQVVYLNENYFNCLKKDYGYLNDYHLYSTLIFYLSSLD